MQWIPNKVGPVSCIFSILGYGCSRGMKKTHVENRNMGILRVYGTRNTWEVKNEEVCN